MAVIGITGSIASGKSTFRDLLAEVLGAESLDADALAKNLLGNDLSVRSEVLAAISPDAYAPDGSPDRSLIRRIIYNDPAAKLRLEAVLHPRVRKLWEEAAGRARVQGSHLIVDIPLLFETDAAGSFDHVITVACSPDVQFRRLVERGIEGDLAKKIIRSQMSVPEKIARSSQVVWNDGGLPALRDQAEHFAASRDFTRCLRPAIAPAGDPDR